MLPRGVIDQLRSNASAPGASAQPTQGRAKFVNGKFVLADEQNKGSGDQGFLSGLIGEASGIGGAGAGAAIGTAIAPGIGTLAGGFLGGLFGGTGGQLAEQKIRDNEFRPGEAAKFGLAEGVFGAGPLRLLKGAGAATKAARGGSTIAGALKAGGDAGANFTLRRAGAKSVNKAAEQASGRFSDAALGFSPTQFETVLKNTGMDVQDILKREGLFGKPQQQIISKLDDLNKDFGNKLTNVKNIDVSTIRNNFASKIKPLIDDVNPDIQTVGKRAKDKADTIVKNLTKQGTTNKAVDINSLKSSLADSVNYKKVANDPDLADVNKVLGDALRETVQQASGNRALKDLGLRIRDLNEVVAPLAKQVNKGRGSKPVRFSTGQGLIGGALAGSSLGGPIGGSVGAGLGAIGAMAANSPRGARSLARAAQNVAGRTSKDTTTPVKSTISSALAGAPIASAIANQSSPGNITNPTNTQTAINRNPNINATIDNTTIPQQSQIGNPYDPQFAAQNAQSILAQGGDLSDVQKYLSIVEALQELRNPEQNELGAEAQKRALTAQSGIRSLDTLDTALQDDPGAFQRQTLPNPLGITARITGTTDVRAATDNVVDVIARLRSGAAITDSEAARFARLLPQPGDSQESALLKLQNVRAELESFIDPSSAL